jgi:hypothetical protein
MSGGMQAGEYSAEMTNPLDFVLAGPLVRRG